jgi:acetyltransferase-like isoleucine patch superfamily enzyme
MRRRPTAEETEARERLRRFRRGETEELIFRHPTGHPATPTGFCFCDRGPVRMLFFCVKAALLDLVLKLPWNGPKLRLLRRLGARIGDNVYISARAWIDPMFPDLLTIEDNVFIGMEARILMHEFRIDEFRAGKVILRRGCMVGAFALIGCGTEIGEGATVGAAACVKRAIPAGATAIGNPVRVLRAGAPEGELENPQPPAGGGNHGASRP